MVTLFIVFILLSCVMLFLLGCAYMFSGARIFLDGDVFIALLAFLFGFLMTTAGGVIITSTISCLI